MTGNKVFLSKRAHRDLLAVPCHIVSKLKSWVDLVETSGIGAARRIPGYHDEPLRARRLGHRSIRLSRSYRAFYLMVSDGVSENIVVQEVTKHGY